MRPGVRSLVPALAVLAGASCARVGTSAEPLFVPGPSVVVGHGSGGIFLADLDRDGRLDLVMKHLLGRSVAVALGDGRGRFAARSPVTFAFEPGNVAFADVVGDGVLDLGVASLEFADVDEDGRLDAVLANGRRDTIEFLSGDGRGPFARGPVVRLESGRSRHTFALGDADGDSRLDLVVASTVESGASSSFEGDAATLLLGR